MDQKPPVKLGAPQTLLTNNEDWPCLGGGVSVAFLLKLVLNIFQCFELKVEPKYIFVKRLCDKYFIGGHYHIWVDCISWSNPLASTTKPPCIYRNVDLEKL